VLDFLKSTSGTHALPPVLLDTGDDNPDWPAYSSTGSDLHYLFIVMKTNRMHCLSSIYFINQPLHVLGMFIAHHQEVFTVYVKQIPPDDGQ
jgi:hypothetical protein